MHDVVTCTPGLYIVSSDAHDTDLYIPRECTGIYERSILEDLERVERSIAPESYQCYTLINSSGNYCKWSAALRTFV